MPSAKIASRSLDDSDSIGITGKRPPGVLRPGWEPSRLGFAGVAAAGDVEAGPWPDPSLAARVAARGLDHVVDRAP